VLPSEATETGVYLLGLEFANRGLLGADSPYTWGPISFPIPLPAPLDSAHMKIITPADLPLPLESKCENAEHPGAASVKNPEAEPGYLCVFQADTLNMSGVGFSRPGSFGEEEALVSGVMVIYEIAEAAIENELQGRAEGTWAVTAPE
jgi:hypothetical protein